MIERTESDSVDESKTLVPSPSRTVSANGAQACIIRFRKRRGWDRLSNKSFEAQGLQIQ